MKDEVVSVTVFIREIVYKKENISAAVVEGDEERRGVEVDCPLATEQRLVFRALDVLFHIINGCVDGGVDSEEPDGILSVLKGAR